MYSMETFLPYTLNKAESEKDASKVLSLGPFGWTVQYATVLAKREDQFTNETIFYRGMNLPL